MQYAVDNAKKQITGLLTKFSKEPIVIEIPPENIDADFAVPLFNLSKENHKSLKELASEIQGKIVLDETLFSKVEFQGAYLNFYLDKNKYSKLVFEDYKNLKEKYGKSNIGENETILIDYSSPNIAKPFSVGHLRSTVIGQALYNIYEFLGYKVIGDNHIGDWGTQFGKLICAYKKWGDDKGLEKEPINELLRLYVKFHAEAKINPELEDEAREWFRRLENDDQEANDIWKKFSELSKLEFDKIYKDLNVEFDVTLGESFYKDKTEEIVAECLEKKVANWIPAINSDGSENENEKVLAVDLRKYGIDTPILLKKSDGTTLYATRDLAAIKYRIVKWNPDKMLYVVGSEQKFYFKQLFKTAEILSYKPVMEHIDFGLIRFSDGKMSTREGRVIFLEDVLKESINKVKEILNVREMNEKESDEVAKIVGYGAIKYADLSQNRIHNVMFDWDKVVTLKGNSGPYLQYQYVRILSILNKTDKINMESSDFSLLSHNLEQKLIIKISMFNSVVMKIADSNEPHLLATYLYELAQSFSKFYEELPILNADNNLRNSRLMLSEITAQVIKNGLSLLGIDVPTKM